jgi:cobalt/nickel transport system permease protein
MPGTALLPLWAVHISDGVLTWPWLAAGFVGMITLALLGAWRVREEEVPRVALLTAAFFVASLIHVRVGPTSVHLLLNGLVGVVLGLRAALAIPLGLALQALLIGHGGASALGVNSCVMTLPALLSWQLFAGLRRVPWVRRPWFRSTLVGASALAWTLSLVYSLTLLCSNRLTELDYLDTEWANFVTFHPATLTAALALAALAVAGERRLENAPEFPLGLLVGELAVLATMALNCVALIGGGERDWHALALATFVAHLPIAVIEGTVLGFAVGFLARVKPEMIGWSAADETPGPAPTPANGAGPTLAEKAACSADPLP